MWTTSKIKGYINGLPPGKLFTSRDLLTFGTRSAVDQTVFVLVETGFIQRLARGVFRKVISSMAPSVSALEVATVKAAAFGKTIMSLHTTPHTRPDLGPQSLTECTDNEMVFATSGPSSSMCYGSLIIRFKSVGPRKRALGDSKVGKALRSLWHGKITDPGIITAVCLTFFRSDHDELRSRHTAAMLPAWLAHLFRYQWRIESRPSRQEKAALRKERELTDRLYNGMSLLFDPSMGTNSDSSQI